jgi:DNA topoisomerase I
MSKSLVIVESPAKVKNIQSYLGSNYIVKASVGHVRDLPVRGLGVDLDTYKPTYVISKGKEAVVKGLKSAMRLCDNVIIATDSDREGEAIGWHLLALLKPQNHSRAIFNEITKKAVTHAVNNPGLMDMKMVAAQETRRVIDRLVGYQITPLLTRAAASPTPLSAGRVQSVALRIICENDLSITEFNPEPHYKVFANFGEGEIKWKAEWQFKELLSPELTKDDKAIWRNKEKAQELVNSVNNDNGFIINSIKKTESKSSAPCAFTTSLLQQAASNSLGFSTSETMQVAQKLFEEGLITYHRTDNKNLAAESIDEARQWISKWQASKGLPDLVPVKPNTWKNKDDAQEAHEAIRPTSFDNLGSEIKDEKQQKLYKLIWRRAIASQMIPAVYDVTTVELLSDARLDSRSQKFIAKGRIQREAGWRRLTGSDQSDEDDKEKSTNQLLPELNEHGSLTCSSAKLDDLKTKPPARYTEASLVATLEKKGVGRPSTYASIISTLIKRAYIVFEKRKAFPTKLGRQVNGGLVGNFGFLEIDFTVNTEKKLDLIAQGKGRYKEVVQSLQEKLVDEIIAFTAKGVTINTGIKTFDCPSCAVGKLVKRKVKKSKPFFSCNNYPECTTTFPLKNNAPDFDWEPPKASEFDCPKCKKNKLVKRDGKFGDYFSCEDSKGCSHIMKCVDGKPVEKAVSTLSEHDCPKCKKKKLILRKGNKGDFYGCSGYPKCKHTCQPEDISNPT